MPNHHYLVPGVPYDKQLLQWIYLTGTKIFSGRCAERITHDEKTGGMQWRKAPSVATSTTGGKWLRCTGLSAGTFSLATVEQRTPGGNQIQARQRPLGWYLEKTAGSPLWGSRYYWQPSHHASPFSSSSTSSSSISFSASSKSVVESSSSWTLRNSSFSTTTTLGSAESSAESPSVLWHCHERDPRIGVMTLNAPASYNALTVEMGREFQQLCHRLITSMTGTIPSGMSSSSSSPPAGAEQVQVILLQGAGGQAFSAGGHLSWLHNLRHQTLQANAEAMRQFYQSFLVVRQLPVPVLAVLHGPAMGAGAALALACDLRLATSPCRHLLGFHFVNLGIHAGMGASYYLPQVLSGGSTGLVNEILLTGQVLSSEQAYQHGLVNHLAAATNTTTTSGPERVAAVDELALTTAQRWVVGRHPLAVRLTLQTLRQQQDVGLQAALQREAWMQAVCYQRQDWGRGLDAVANKTIPEFDPYSAP